MDAVAGALAVPLTSLDPGPKDGVNRTLTYDSSVEDAQCPYFREKDITGADRHAPADPAPEEPARTIDPAPKGPADPAPKEVARTIDQAPRGPPADRAPKEGAPTMDRAPKGPERAGPQRTPVKKKSKSHQGSPPESSTPPSTPPPTKPNKKCGKSPTYWRIFVCKRCVHTIEL